MRAFLIAVMALFATQVAVAGHHEKSMSAQNIENAATFMAAVFPEPDKAKSLLHDDFEFIFMGRTRISNISYDRETYFTVWLKQIVANLVPDGFRKLEVIDAIGDENGVALMMEGEADGINGLYDNKYVFIFKFKDGKIATLHEYNSDLLVATRLYKQKLVADD